MKKLKYFIYLVALVFVVIAAKKIIAPNFYRKAKVLSDDVVLQVKEIKIPGKVIFNPSIIEKENGDGYYFIFRINQIPACSAIVDLDNKLNPILESYREIDTGCFETEDIRVFKTDKNIYFIAFNAPIDIYKKRSRILCRHMHLAQIDMKSGKCKDVVPYELHLQGTEKNWMPFVYNGDEINFVYRIQPHKILKVVDPKSSELFQPININNEMFRRISYKWGSLRGGTPAIEVDGVYFAFFHAVKRHTRYFHRKVYYSMGGYTFEKEPPFRVLSAAKQPLVSKYNKSNRIVFPSGFVVAKYNGKQVFHLSYGVDDCKAYIMTLDKNKYMSTLTPVKY